MSGDAQSSADVGGLSPEMMEVALELWGQSGEAHFLPVTGGSMRPMLIEGDQVLVAPSKAAKIGDIVVFRRRDELVTHRVLWIDELSTGERYLHTKGDHVLSMDAPISEAELVGRVIGIRRGSQSRNIESLTGRAISKMMATLMRLQTGLYTDSEEKSSGKYSVVAYTVRRFLSQILLQGCGLFMWISQSFFGRWTV